MLPLSSKRACSRGFQPRAKLGSGSRCCSGEFTSPYGGIKPPLHQTVPLQVRASVVSHLRVDNRRDPLTRLRSADENASSSHPLPQGGEGKINSPLAPLGERGRGVRGSCNIPSSNITRDTTLPFLRLRTRVKPFPRCLVKGNLTLKQKRVNQYTAKAGVARACSLGPRLLPLRARKKLDLPNRSALPLC